MLLGLMEEKPPDKGLAIITAILTGLSATILIMGIISISKTVNRGFVDMYSETPMIINTLLGSIGIVLGIILGIASGILQAIVIYSWNRATNTNIDNTKILFQLALEKVDNDRLKTNIQLFINALSRLRISAWPFWIYIALFVSIPFAGPFYVEVWGISTLFLFIYLHSVFTTSLALSNIKMKAYACFLDNIENYSQLKIKERPLIKLILLSIATIMIYWLYILVDFTRELEEFVTTDQLLRAHIIGKLR